MGHILGRYVFKMHRVGTKRNVAENLVGLPGDCHVGSSQSPAVILQGVAYQEIVQDMFVASELTTIVLFGQPFNLPLHGMSPVLYLPHQP